MYEVCFFTSKCCSGETKKHRGKQEIMSIRKVTYMKRQLILVDQLNVSYNGRPAVKNVSFNVQTGKLIGIIGPNGAGKSTLMKAVIGLIPKDRGTVEFEHQPLKEVQRDIAYVPQRNNI